MKKNVVMVATIVVLFITNILQFIGILPDLNSVKEIRKSEKENEEMTN